MYIGSIAILWPTAVIYRRWRFIDLFPSSCLSFFSNCNLLSCQWTGYRRANIRTEANGRHFTIVFRLQKDPLRIFNNNYRVQEAIIRLSLYFFHFSNCPNLYHKIIIVIIESKGQMLGTKQMINKMFNTLAIDLQDFEGDEKKK